METNNNAQAEPYHSKLISCGFNLLDYSKKHFVYRKDDKIIKVAKSEYNNAANDESFLIEKVTHDLLLGNNLPVARIFNIYKKGEFLDDFTVLEEEYCNGDVFYYKDCPANILLQIWEFLQSVTKISNKEFGFIDKFGDCNYYSWTEFLRFIAKTAKSDNELLLDGISKIPNNETSYLITTDINTANFIFDNGILEKVIDIERSIYGDRNFILAVIKQRNLNLYKLVANKFSIDNTLLNYYCLVYKHLFDYLIND